MVRSAPFTLCKLIRNERPYWYVMFRHPETGERLTKRSVEVLRKELGDYNPHPVKRREEAVLICKDALDKGLVFSRFPDVTLLNYLMQFWNWEQSYYIQRKITISPESISKDYVYTRSHLIAKHVLPLLSSRLLLRSTTMLVIKDLQYQLVRERTLSHATINVVMSAVMVALREAERDGRIPANTLKALPQLPTKQKIRGIFSETEIKVLMNFMRKDYEWRIRLASMLSLVTGMRSGEIRALRREAIGDGIITVSEAYGNQTGVKLPKGKRIRQVPCPVFLCKLLIEYSEKNTFIPDNTLVFWSAKHGGYVSSHYFSDKLREVILLSGTLSSEELNERNISFHSFRHMANTLLRGSIDESVLRLTIGHQSSTMSDTYTHFSERARQSIEIAQKTQILPLILPA